MSTSAWWMLVIAGLMLGTVSGGWAALRFARSRFDAQLRKATDEVSQRHATMIEQLRSAQARSQSELEQTRSSLKRQLAAMSAEPRAALDRAEGRLKAAYAELDRLRGSSAPDSGMAELTDGFAATRPMHKGM